METATATADTPEPITIEPLVVSGMTFVPQTETTFEQDLYLMRLCRKAGLDQPQKFFEEGRSDEENATEMLMAMYDADIAFDLMAGVLVEEGAAWDRARAKRNAAVFRTVSDRATKQMLQSALIALLLGFFMSGIGSSLTSRKSSRRETPETVPSNDQTAAPTTSASGESSSAPSPGTTPRASPSS